MCLFNLYLIQVLFYQHYLKMKKSNLLMIMFLAIPFMLMSKDRIQTVTNN